MGKNDDLIYGMKDAAVDLIKNYARANNGSVPEVGWGNRTVAAEGAGGAVGEGIGRQGCEVERSSV